MIGIGKSHKALVTIATLASILIVNAITMGAAGHIALARHDNTKVFENSHINVQTDTNQGQTCETAGGTSPISGSRTASSTNTISQGTPPAPPSPCTSHPTVLTLTITTSGGPGFLASLTGTLTDTCTGSGVPGATITFTYSDTPRIPPTPAVTGPAGTYGRNFNLPLGLGAYTVQAHFAGQGMFGPSNSPTQTYLVAP